MGQTHIQRYSSFSGGMPYWYSPVLSRENSNWEPQFWYPQYLRPRSTDTVVYLLRISHSWLLTKSLSECDMQLSEASSWLHIIMCNHQQNIGVTIVNHRKCKINKQNRVVCNYQSIVWALVPICKVPTCQLYFFEISFILLVSVDVKHHVYVTFIL